jgi:dolichol kinase
VTLSLLRKAFHFSGIIIPLIYLVGNRNVALFVTFFLLVMIAALEWLRIKGYLHSAFLEKHLKETEKKGPTASLFFLLSSLVTILFFDKPVAVASILLLCISDPLASICGRMLGRRMFFGKSIEGSAAFFLSAIAILQFFPFKQPAIFSAALAATAAELFSSRFVDDNLSIPIVTALALTVLQ